MSHAVKNEIPERDYLNAVVADLEQHAPDIWGRPVESIFFGGGTPSLMTSDGLDYLLGKIRAIVKLEPRAEVTLEANPGAADQQQFIDYRKAGINRLSIGVQSFNDKHLQSLGRIHKGEEAVTACHSALNAGFDNINLDLMHGLPNQNIDDAINDIDTALSLKPSHISYYQLTIEPNTLFAASPPALPVEDDLWAIQEHGKNRLARAGFEQYEVSAYAQPGRRCHHNMNYWLFGDYLGIGAGAHSKLSFPAHNSIIRHSKRRQPADYIKNADTQERIQGLRAVEVEDARLEFMMNALRLNDGFSVDEFQGRCGELISAVRPMLTRAESDGLLNYTHSRVTPTELGLRFLDTLLQRFMHTDPQQDSQTATSGKVIPIHSSP